MTSRAIRMIRGGQTEPRARSDLRGCGPGPRTDRPSGLCSLRQIGSHPNWLVGAAHSGALHNLGLRSSRTRAIRLANQRLDSVNQLQCDCHEYATGALGATRARHDRIPHTPIFGLVMRNDAVDSCIRCRTAHPRNSEAVRSATARQNPPHVAPPDSRAALERSHDRAGGVVLDDRRVGAFRRRHRRDRADADVPRCAAPPVRRDRAP